jgi:exonuclease III
MDCIPKIGSWNARGLNDGAKRDAIREFFDSLHVNLVCLQETKMEHIDRFIVMQTLGPAFDGFAYLPAQETRGGILLAWNTSILEVANVVLDTYSITGEVITRGGQRWWITGVYGP